MIVWLDAQLSPALADWFSATFGVACTALRDLGLQDATDVDIFQAARKAGAVVVSKDYDFVELVKRHGAPPQLVWVTCGNATNDRMRRLFSAGWPQVAKLLAAGEVIVELGE